MSQILLTLAAVDHEQVIECNYDTPDLAKAAFQNLLDSWHNTDMVTISLTSPSGVNVFLRSDLKRLILIL